MHAPDNAESNRPSNFLAWFRAIALAEGVSFLVLLGIAMPLKYLAGHPEAVHLVGSLHGFLFVCYVVMAVPLFTHHKWPVERAPWVFAAAVLPFGTFLLERRWLK